MKSDKQLKADVEAELADEPAIDAAHVGVAAQGGVVTLTGHLRSYAEKTLVERTVSRVGGVDAIAMDLDVRLAPDLVRPLAGVRGLTNRLTLAVHATTADVAERIGAALQRHARLEMRGIAVAVRGTTVTLKGHVDNWADRKAAQEAASAAPGVNKVVNEILIQAQG